MFRRVFLAVGIAAALGPVPGMAQGVPADISGQYRVEGRNADGSAYAGLVNVNQSGGGVGFAWVVGSQSYSGTGTREGRVVTVHWGDSTPVVYVVMPDGTLHGTWADGRALERLSR
ncbi:MAG: hypothetical protein VXW58_00230 [Pseudomonadota bacterium]|nr:hypothetical protein [Pseudomonadota bacterium]